MNHDATHCGNWTKACPKSCYRAQLTEDLHRIGYALPTSWSNFKYTKHCPKWPNKPADPATNDNRCIACGDIIPEGKLVCPKCERKYD